MKYLISLGFLYCSLHSFSQSDSLNYFIKKLDWNSFEVTASYVPRLVLKKDAEKLIAIDDEKKIDKLINNLSNNKKTVAIHMILTKIIDSSYSTIGQEYTYGKDGTITSIRFLYNGLTWTLVKRKKHVLKRKDIITIKKYWKKKLKQH